MKRLTFFFSALVLILAVHSNMHAQGLTATVAAAAEVVANIANHANQGIDFAGIPQNITTTTPDIEVTTGNATNTSGTTQLGYQVVIATSGTSVSFSWSDIKLVNDSNSNYRVNFAPQICVDQGDDVDNSGGNLGSISTSCNSAAETGTSTTPTIDDNAGFLTIWVGGELNTPEFNPGSGFASTSSLAAGTYTGNLTLAIDYSF